MAKLDLRTSVPWNKEPEPFDFKWNFGEKKWKFFRFLKKLFTLYTKPKLAKIRPNIGFSQAK